MFYKTCSTKRFVPIFAIELNKLRVSEFSSSTSMKAATESSANNSDVTDAATTVVLISVILYCAIMKSNLNEIEK